MNSLASLSLENFDSNSDIYNHLTSKLLMPNIEYLGIRECTIDAYQQEAIHALFKGARFSLESIVLQNNKWQIHPFYDFDIILSKVKTLVMNIVLENEVLAYLEEISLQRIFPALENLVSKNNALPFEGLSKVFYIESLRTLVLRIKLLDEQVIDLTEFVKRLPFLSKVTLDLVFSETTDCKIYGGHILQSFPKFNIYANCIVKYAKTYTNSIQ